jgi:alpha-1,3-rhamnosyl/mannosyltransferase
MAGPEDKELRVGIDMRWLQRAYLNSPIGAVAGIGMFTQNLWRGLAESAPAVDLVALVSREPLAEPFLRLIQSAPRHEIYAVGLAGLLPRLERRGKYMQILTLLETELGLGMSLGRLGLDVLHLTDHRPPPRSVSCPTVATLHDLFEFGQGWAVHRYLCSQISQASRVVAVSNATHDDYVRNPARHKTEISVVHNGIDLGVFMPRDAEPEDVRAKFELPGEYFIHAGVLSPRKNPVGLFRALAKVITRTPKEAYLVNVGPYGAQPGMKETVVDLAQQAGIADRLILIEDGASPEEMAALYRSSIGLVFPSPSEGFGLPAVECLACGVPCVVSNTGASPEVVGELGILVDPHDPDDIAEGMVRLLDDESHRAMVRTKGPEWTERFSYQAMAAGYMAIYRELADAPAGGRH